VENLETIVHETVLQVAQQRTPTLVKVENDDRLTGKLGFSSLDVAQLVAILEIKLGFDPFATQVAITSIHTVGDLCQAYRQCCPTASGQDGEGKAA